MTGGLCFLRSELAYVAAMHPDTQDDWSETGLKALCLLAGEKQGKVSTATASENFRYTNS